MVIYIVCVLFVDDDILKIITSVYVYMFLEACVLRGSIKSWTRKNLCRERRLIAGDTVLKLFAEFVNLSPSSGIMITIFI